jgi:phosphoribosylanthranilate isomerase
VDALSAADAGADALGFVLWKGSPRRVEPSALPGLIADLPAAVDRVGVFVDATRAEIEQAATMGIARVQLCGSESPEFCEALALPWYKVFRIGTGPSPAALVATIRSYASPTFMLDAGSASRPGGTGETVDWREAAKVSIGAALGGASRLILAGGLTPENVATAIGLVRPWGVDVSSGVESSPGRKDHGRVRAFVDAVRDFS